MTTTINAVSGTGLTQTSDGSGIVKLQSNGVATNALAWVNFAGASGTRNASYNVSSVTRTAAGYYTITLTNAMADANYVIVNNHQYSNSSGGSDDVFGGWIQNINPTTTSYQVYTRSASSGNIDVFAFHSVVFGN